MKLPKIKIQIMKKDSDALRKELEKEAPFLAGLKDKPEGLSVPEGYFDQLQKDVLKRVAKLEKPRSKTIRLWPRIAAAASVLLVLGLAIFLFQPSNPAETTFTLTDEEVHQYISQNIEDFELDLLMEYVAVSDQSSGLFDDAELELEEYMDELLDEIDMETLEELL